MSDDFEIAMRGVLIELLTEHRSVRPFWGDFIVRSALGHELDPGHPAISELQRLFAIDPRRAARMVSDAGSIRPTLGAQDE